MQYYTIATEIGTAAASNAFLTGTKVNITTFVVGDGGGIEYAPTPDMTELRSEVWRGVVSHAEIDTDSPNVINYTALLPSTVGGFVMREMGIMDDQGRLIGIGNMASTPKIRFDQGISDEIELTFSLTISSPEAMEWKVDPTVILATKADIAAHNLSVESHPDIRDELSDINTQLSNKAEAMPINIDETVDIFTLQNGTYRYEGKIPAGKNYPPEIPTGDTVHVSVLALDRKDWEAGSGYGMLIVCDNLTRVMWQNCKSYGLWRGWLPIATAERPRGYTVALASGINMFANNSIYKKQNGEVVINLSFTSSKEIAHESVIGTLPEGFRPASRLEIAFWMRGSGGGTISIGTNGAMTVYKTGNIAANTPCFINSLTYLAAP